MVTIESTAEHCDGVTLVTATVAGADAPRRVTLASRLDGPVWPPRRQGEPEAGWSDDGFAGVVPAEGQLAIGFASPAEPVDPPMEVVATEPAAAPTDDMDSPAAVVRGLGDPTPPALIDVEGAADGTDGSSTESTDAGVDVRENGRETTRDATATGHDGRTRTIEPKGEDGVVDAPSDATNGESTVPAGGSPTAADESPAPPPDEDLPPAVAEWLADVEARLDCAAGLDPDASVDEATEALRACGGVTGARALEDRLAADVRRLRTLRWRAGELEERAEAASVATAALEELP